MISHFVADIGQNPPPLGLLLRREFVAVLAGYDGVALELGYLYGLSEAVRFVNVKLRPRYAVPFTRTETDISSPGPLQHGVDLEPGIGIFPGRGLDMPGFVGRSWAECCRLPAAMSAGST